MKWLDKLLNREDLNGHDTCPTYMVRWVLFRHGDVAVYLHHFLTDDWSIDMHDHPKRFWSIGLWGRYVEETPRVYYTSLLYDGVITTRPRTQDRKWTTFNAPWFRTFPANWVHRIINPVNCWTLVIVGPAEREWGWWHGDEQWIQWQRYCNDKELCEQVKIC